MCLTYKIPNLPLDMDIETKKVLKQLSISSRYLAELKGVAKIIPNENVLISTQAYQEAKDSCSVENIMTTQDSLYKEDIAIKPST